MKLIKPSFNIEYITPNPLQTIEQAARICYQSKPKDKRVGCFEYPGEDTQLNSFIKKLLKRGHMTPFEMIHMRVKIICDRGVSHELVRHRLCSFNQESTRYVRYDDEMEFILPCWLKDIKNDQYDGAFLWKKMMLSTEKTYQDLLKLKWTPEQARTVLPNSLKTELIMSTNIREWMHIFKLRCSNKAHPQMREIMIPLREAARETIPIVFDK